MFKIKDKVRVVNGKNEVIKEGIVIKQTNIGAMVIDTNCRPPYTEYVDFAEWFPFSSRERRIIAA